MSYDVHPQKQIASPGDTSLKVYYSIQIAGKIIHELTSAIFKAHFIQTLLVPQQPMAISAFKDLFRKLAHSSIMKLDQSSMEKLLYLILMTVKKELFMMSSPLQLYSLTLGNLRLLQQHTKGTPSHNLIQSDITIFSATAQKYSFTEYKQAQQYLLSLLENYQTKVINFFENGQQDQNGKLTFIPRNAHNSINIGQGKNHPSIKLNSHSKLSMLHLSSWKQWKTSLVMDHVNQYDRQSQQRRINNEMGWVGKEKNLNDLFGLSKDEVSDFEVQLDLFDYGQSKKSAKTMEKKDQTKVTEGKGKQQQSSSITNKINKEFQELKLEKQEEIDLLDMMDN